jgi:hypothetical protein
MLANMRAKMDRWVRHSAAVRALSSLETINLAAETPKRTPNTNIPEAMFAEAHIPKKTPVSHFLERKGSATHNFRHHKVNNIQKKTTDWLLIRRFSQPTGMRRKIVKEKTARENVVSESERVV